MKWVRRRGQLELLLRFGGTLGEIHRFLYFPFSVLTLHQPLLATLLFSIIFTFYIPEFRNSLYFQIDTNLQS